MAEVCWWWRPLLVASSFRRKGGACVSLTSRAGLRDRWRRGRATSPWFSGDGVGGLGSVCTTVGDTAGIEGTKGQYMGADSGLRVIEELYVACGLVIQV
jgi:hypothetical protein